MNEARRVALSYQEGSSDKVYQAALEPAGTDLWVVNFAYGRRGAAMQTGTKTQKPVAFEQAEKILSKLVNEKLSKGYKVDDASNIDVQTPVDKVQTGLHVQLLKPIEEEEVDSFLEDDDYVAQEKMDGERKVICKQVGEVKASNRKAIQVNTSSAIIQDLQLRTKYDNFIMDGEQIGDIYHVFDLLYFNNDLKSVGYIKRYEQLKELCENSNFQNIRLVKAVSGFVPKTKMLNTLIREGKEGIVFKKKDAKYVPGRNSGTQFKRKFYETASFLVTELNDKRSVQIAVIADDAILPVGNVTVPVNHPLPGKGSIIEVRYLYAYRGGSVYQPVYLGKRSDLNAEDCSISQLKYKGEAKNDEDN